MAIIGGGYAGLSAARHLKKADPSLSITLIEQDRIGFGASGRNAGILSPFFPISWLVDCTKTSHRLEEIRFAAEYIRQETQELLDLINADGISCDLRRNEIFTTNADWKRKRLLPLLGERILLTRLPGRLATRDELDAVFPNHPGGEGYVLEGYSLNPLALAQGLARHAHRLGIEIFEDTEIEGIRPAPSGAELISTSGPRIVARKVVIATNAYTHKINLGRPVSIPGPTHTYLLATKELSSDLLDRLQFRNATLVEIGSEYFYARMARNRLLFGGFDRIDRSSASSPKADEVFFWKLEKEMRRMIPSLSGTAVEARWTGPYHESRTQVPIIRPLPHLPDIILNVGYGGVGVTLTQFSGKLVAGLVLGNRHRDERSERMLDLYHTTRFPLWEGLKLVFRALR